MFEICIGKTGWNKIFHEISTLKIGNYNALIMAPFQGIRPPMTLKSLK